MPQVVAAVGVIVTSFVGAAISTTLGIAMASVGAFAIGAATIVAAGMLANKIIANLYEMPTMDTDASRQSTVKSTVEPQKIIYGETLVSGPISFVGVAGSKNRILYHAVVLAGHEVNAITDVHFDNEVIANSQINGSGFVTGGIFGPKSGDVTKDEIAIFAQFLNYICKITKYTGATGQTADPDLEGAFAAYTSNHKGTGLAYIVTQWVMKGSSKETWDQYTPQNIKALVQGRKVYDYRLDTETIKPNVNNASFIAYSTNPVWCLIDYLINTDFGMSVNPNRIDWDAAVVAADACDATVSVPGGTENRFTCNGVLFGTDTHKTNINKLLSSMNGMLSYTNGQFVIRAGAYEAPSVSLDEDSLAGAVSVKTSVERSDRFNTVTGVFIDPSQNYKSTEFPEVFTTAARTRDNGEILTKEIQLPMTNSRYMAQRIANKLVQQSDQQKVVTFPTNLSGMEVAVGDRVSVSLDEFNWSNKVFLCLGWTLSDSGNGGVNLILREDDSGSYADPAVGEYSTISATGALVEGFRGVPDPSNLSATAGLKSIELNWTNPDNMSDVLFVEVFASPDSSWDNRVKIGEVNGTQFFHDGSTTADPLAIGDQRYYWVRARAYSTGEDATAVSDRNPDNDTSTISATVGGVDFDDVVGDAKPEDNATVGATVGTDLYDTDGTTVLSGADVLNEVLEQQILNIQIESGEVLDLETGQDVIIQNLGDVAIYVNESNQILNSTIGSLSNSFSNLENTIVDLTSGVSDVYVQATPPVAGVGSIPDPIPTFSRWYDSDDSNEPYYWDGTQWASLADPRIASNAASITTLQSGLNNANLNISGNSSAISVLDATTISQGNSIVSISADVSILQSGLETAEGDILATSSAVSGLTTRVEATENSISSQSDDIAELESTVNDPATGVTASANAISGLTTRVEANENSISSQASQTTVLNASLADLVYIQDEADSVLETEAGEELLLNLATDVSTATSEIVDTLDSRVVATEQGIVSQSQALTQLGVDLETVDGDQKATADALSSLTVTVSDTESGVFANAQSIESLSGTVDANSASIVQINTVSATSDSTIAQAVFNLNAVVGDNVADIADAIDLIATAQATADGKVTTFYQDDAPTAEGDGDLWVDTNDGNKLYRWDSTLATPVWVEVRDSGIAQAIQDAADAQFTADGKIVSFYQDDVPTAAAIGDLWFDTNDKNKLYFWNGSSWVSARDADIAQALFDAASADAKADGKVTTFYQDEPPTAEGNGDLWVDTNDSNKLYRWDATLEIPAWVEIRDAGIAKAIQDASEAQETADGKIVSFFQDNAPSSASEGDLWFDTNDGNKAYRWDSTLETPQWVTIQDNLIPQATADIEQINTVSVTSESAIARSVATLVANVGNNAAAITEINTVSVTSESAIARAVSTLSSTVGEDTVTLQNVKEVTDGVSAQYSVTIDNNGHVSGFGLVSDIIDGNPTSDFTISADTFSIGGTGGLSNVSPFVVYTTEQTIVKDGVNVTVPAGVYIGDAFIQSAAIGGTKIADGAITADKIVASSIASAVIEAGSIVVDGDTDVDLSLTGGAAGPVTITSTSLYQGTGTFNNTNTGFYLDSTGQFSLKDRLSFDGTNLSLSGSVTAAAFTLSSGATLVDPSDQISNENNNAFFRYTTTAAGGDVSAPNDTEFNNVFGRNPRLRDVLVVINTASSPEVGAAYIYNGTAWVLEDNFITGDLIVDGTITADKIDVTDLSAINSNLGAITGGSLNINNAFIVTGTGGLTATSATITGDITAQSLDITSATVTGTLSADAIQIDGVTLDTDASGNLIIKDGGVGEEKIATDAVTADKIAANTITASEIAAGTITATEIAADAITADKINVTDLSAISATLGTVTAGTFKTAESGYRVEISDTGDFPIWYGTGTKTAENGLFYVDAEGEVYINAIIVARAGSTVAVFKVSVAPIIKIGFTSSITTDAAVVTISNGTGPYTYSWTRQITTQGPTPTISSSTSASPTFTATGMQVGIDSTSIWEVAVTDTATSETATAQAYVTIVRDA